MSSYRYGILGAGRQGTAAAYDLVVRGEAASVTLADIDGSVAQRAAERVNRLTGRDCARAVSLDVTDRASLVAFLQPLDAFIAAVSYKLNLRIAEAALEAGTSMCDLGGHTATALAQVGLADRARDRGIAIVPDCGEAPGLANNLMDHATTLLDRTDDLLLLDGGLPLHPEPPWNYRVTFAMDGLTNEYAGGADWVRDGRIVHVETFDPAEYELVDLGDPAGELEAFPAGGSSTVPWTLGRRVPSIRNKVLRYPGHVAQFGAFQHAGFFSEEPVLVDGAPVVPRHLFHALIEPQIRAPEPFEDIVIAHVIATGRRDGRPARAVVDLRALRDDSLRFTGMERTTGWHAAIVAHLLASGAIPPGAYPVEEAVAPATIVAALRERGLPVLESVTLLDQAGKP
jgi:lysine 6-dehydrogenase